MNKPATHRYPTRHVALLVETSLAFGRGVLQGIAQYMHLNEPWSVYVQERSVYDDIPSWLNNWQGDGIISRVSSPEVMSKLKTITSSNPNLALIDLNEELTDHTGLGAGLSIRNDNEAIGQMAAEHLIDRGFRKLAYIGYDDIPWSQERAMGFEKIAREKGYPCKIYEWTKSKDSGERWPNWEMELDAIEDWLKTLPRPIGIMACNDFRAIQLMDACQRLRIAVPEQMAVIGVDNEEVACELAYPPLTSVLPDVETIGYRAAEALDKLMHQQQIPFEEVKIKPRAVKVRHSTDIVAIEDPVVAESVYFIRENACKGIDIEDVLDYVGVSRSTLQRRFKNILNLSILDVITNTRMEKVKQLLIETEMSLPEIAKVSGFLHSEYLSHVFKKKTGHTTSEFRRSYPKRRKS